MINVGKYRFEGPVYNRQALKDAAGVYAVLDDRNGRYSVVDIGESVQVRTRLENHDRENCWFRNITGRICYAAHYMPGSTEQQRQAIESELRRRFTPACGVS